MGDYVAIRDGIVTPVQMEGMRLPRVGYWVSSSATCWRNGFIESIAVAWFAVLVVVAQSRRVPVRGRRDASLASKYR